MRAEEKNRIAKWAIKALNDAQDVESVERIYNWADVRVRGSNQRTRPLWKAKNKALERLK